MIQFIRVVTLLAFSSLFFLGDAAPMEKRNGIAIKVLSDTEFCFYLPPKPGDNVGATEEQGKAFCTEKDLSSSGNVFPSGFILSKHFKSTSTYSQVTGRMDPSKYKLSRSDGGGQYDYKDIHGGTCDGYKYFVNLVEPDVGHYCIRCCKDTKDCNTGISTDGCETVVPGDYS